MVAPSLKDDVEPSQERDDDATAGDVDHSPFASERAQFGADGPVQQTPDETDADPTVSGEAPTDDTDETDANDRPSVASVELSDDDFAKATGGLFSGVEDDDDDGSSDEQQSASEETDGDDADPFGGAGAVAGGSGLETTINNGMARLAVVGLDEEYKLDENDENGDCLESEFRDVFATFRMGHFGAKTAEKYILTPGDNVDPAWAFLGAVCVASVFTVQMRPDGDEILSKAKSKVRRKPGVRTDGGTVVEQQRDGPTWSTGDMLLSDRVDDSEVTA